MKTISIRQPWAQLIVTGIKDIENRSWRTNFRGRILIHVPVTRDNPEFTTGQFELIKDIPPGYKSAIIGSVEIVNCIRGHYSIWAEPGCWNWVLKNPVLFDEPITDINGKLSLWDYELKGEPIAKTVLSDIKKYENISKLNIKEKQ